MEEASLRQGLARLVDAEIVFQRGEPPEATYTFKHALVQEAAYESLLKRTRQQLHGRGVDVLRERFPERGAAQPEVGARAAAAEARGDRVQALLGHNILASPEHWQGKFASSLAHCEQAIALWDSAQHHGHVRVHGNDEGITSLAFLAWNLWHRGQPDAALVRA